MTPIALGERLAVSVAAFTLRILHISDLHEGQPGRETLWRRRRVLGETWLENLEVIAGSGRAVDLVCFTGDVAFGGRHEEYVRAADFVRELLRRLGLGPERFFAVSGNHDVDRAVQTEAWRTLRGQIAPHDLIALADAHRQAAPVFRACRSVRSSTSAPSRPPADTPTRRPLC